MTAAARPIKKPSSSAISTSFSTDLYGAPSTFTAIGIETTTMIPPAQSQSRSAGVIRAHLRENTRAGRDCWEVTWIFIVLAGLAWLALATALPRVPIGSRRRKIFLGGSAIVLVMEVAATASLLLR
jgi:hypothetical protein